MTILSKHDEELIEATIEGVSDFGLVCQISAAYTLYEQIAQKPITRYAFYQAFHDNLDHFIEIDIREMKKETE